MAAIDSVGADRFFLDDMLLNASFGVFGLNVGLRRELLLPDKVHVIAKLLWDLLDHAWV